MTPMTAEQAGIVPQLQWVYNWLLYYLNSLYYSGLYLPNVYSVEQLERDTLVNVSNALSNYFTFWA